MSTKFMPIQDPFQLNNTNQQLKTSNDITSQFLQIAQKSSSYQKTRPPMAQRQNSNTQFFIQSSNLQKQLNLIDQRLEEFDKQQRRAGLFDNNEQKINELLILIKDNISEIQQQFNKLVAQQKNCDDKTSFQIRKVIIEIIEVKFINQTTIFDKSIKKRTQILAQNEEKMKEFVKPQEDKVRQRRQPAFKKQSNINLNQDIEGGSVGIGIGDQEEMQTLKGDTKYYQQRQETMQGVTQKIVTIAQQFQKLGSIVKLHEVMIDRIDKNTDDSLYNTQKASKNLRETYRKAASNRALMLKVFLILMVFATIYIVFLL